MAVSPALARLDEALTLLTCGVRANVRPPAIATEMLRDAIALWLNTPVIRQSDPPREVPPVLSLDPLRAAGIPTVDDGTYLIRVAELAERRRLMLQELLLDRWSWNDLMLKSDQFFDAVPADHVLSADGESSRKGAEQARAANAGTRARTSSER